MLNAIIVTLIVVISIWVYLDATKNKIGKVPGGQGVFNMSAGAWAVVTLLLWIIGFPAYLIKRGSLIATAKEHPVDAGGRGAKTAALAIVGGAWVLAAFSMAMDSRLPSCDSAEATQLVGKVLTDLPIAKASGIQYVTVKSINEQGYNKDTEIRSCTGTLVTTAGEDTVQYSVKWNDKDKSEYYVEAQIAN